MPASQTAVPKPGPAPNPGPALDSGAVIVDSMALASPLLEKGRNVVVVVEPDAGHVVAPDVGPGRLAVLIGRPADPAVRSAAEQMAAELFGADADPAPGLATTATPSIREMKIATALSYAAGFKESARQLREMEAAGLDLVWIAEAYGFDGPSLMGYVAALTDRVEIGSGILPIYTRTPTLLAMTAAGVDALSGGRFHLGLGASGPQVIEGWHGVAYDAPLGRTREIADICRKVWARDEPLVHDGRYYHLPLPPEQGTGLGRPLKIIAHPVRPRIPIWVASLGEKNVALTAEVADGWLPILFIPEKAKDVWGSALAEGAARRAAALGPLMLSAGGPLAIGEGEEITRLRDLARPAVALYVGGMGAKGRNFYNDLARRYGFEKEAAEIQDLYLSGKRDEAAARVPQEFLDLTSLIGPRSWVAERIAAMREAGVTHLQVTPIPTGDQTAASLIGEVKDLVG